MEYPRLNSRILQFLYQVKIQDMPKSTCQNSMKLIHCSNFSWKQLKGEKKYVIIN